MMQAAWRHDMGSDRQLKLSARLGELETDAPATFESKLGEGMAHWVAGCAACGVFEVEPDRAKRQPPSAQQAKEAFDLALVQYTRSTMDAEPLTQDPIKKRYAILSTFYAYGQLCFSGHLTESVRIELEESYGGEVALTQAIEGYDFHVDGPVHKEGGPQFDHFRMGALLPPLLLRFGALRSYETWLQKTLRAFQEIGPFTDYASELAEVYFVALIGGAPNGVLCGFEDDARRLLAVTGLAEWADTGMDAFWTTFLSTGLTFCKYNACACVRTCTQARTHTHMHTRTCTHATHAPTYVHTYTHTHELTHTLTHACTQTHT